jgi:uncharacterized protein (TIGR03086 family)
MDAVTALERSYEQLGIVADISADDLATLTPCEGWDVRTLLNHTLGAGRMFTLATRGESVPEDGGDLVGKDPAAALAGISRANVESWRVPGVLEGELSLPFGSFPAQAALCINVGEAAVHAWDIGRACGRDVAIDPEVAQLVLDFYLPMPLDDYRAHGAFGPIVDVPATASAQDRLLGYLGRNPA